MIRRRLQVPDPHLVGVDPGFTNAAVAVIPPGGMPVWMHVTPLETLLDIDGVVAFLEEHLPRPWDRHIATIEKVHSFPKQGVASTFKFATGYGQLVDRIQALGLRWNLATPQAWKKTQLSGLNKSTKAASIQRVQGLFPGIELRRPTGGTTTIRSNTKPWDGAADSILIARHGPHAQ